jgi:poly-gamma-glutamate synthesis protein (capsule biosynthesis protein)
LSGGTLPSKPGLLRGCLALLLGVAAFRAAAAAEPDGAFRMALTGDSILTRRLSVYAEPEFLRLVELIRGADAAFTNLEMLFHDFEPYAMHESGGTYMRAEPALAKELVWAGFDLVSRANNHTGDYGVLGMTLTTRHVADAGLVQAGVGMSLPEAREAKFLETAKARVALVSAASTFPEFSRAGKTRGDVPPRPGLNPIRYSTTYVVTRDQLEALRRMGRDLGMSPRAEGDALSLFRSQFRAGEKADVLTAPHAEDLEEIAAVVRNASALADYTIVSVHAHEGDGSNFVPARFLVTFARAMIDAGADVFVGHGPHVLRGIEIYKGKPILYSLGDFIFQNETLLRLPAENYEPFGLGPNHHVADFNDRRYDGDRRGFPARREVWEAVVVALPVFRGKTLVELKLVPIDLGFGRPRSLRGRPQWAGPELGRKIIGDLARLSLPFGTTVEQKDGLGVVRLPAR